MFYLSLTGLMASKTVKMAVVTVDGNIASFCFYSKRAFDFNLMSRYGFSIGLVTTLEKFRGKGFATELIEKISILASECKVSFVYLQGIPYFYSKLGFQTFAPKSRFVFDPERLRETGCQIVKLSEHRLSDVARLNLSYSDSIRSLVKRSEEDWLDLFRSIANTFLFFRPRGILCPEGKLVGYFCTSPNNPRELREFVVSQDRCSALIALTAAASYLRSLNGSKLEIFSPNLGPLLDLSRSTIEADFICHYRPFSSNLYRVICSDFPESELRNSFVLQGDNL